MDRRRALKTSTVLLAAPVMVTPLAGCTGELKAFTSWPQAREAVRGLLLDAKTVEGNPWNLSQVLQHLAQSVEFSMRGFPALKGAWFRSTLGSAAFAVFNARGAMSHTLDEPIPGAPAGRGTGAEDLGAAAARRDGRIRAIQRYAAASFRLR
jgi:hypothetical protein